MKKKFLAIFAVAALLMGMTGCTSEDNPATPTPIDVNAIEEDLVGLWWDEFEYSDVTEAGDPFTRAMLVVSLDEDRTGTMYLAVFNGTNEEPLAVYGGEGESDFTWKVLEDGSLELGDPVTGETFKVSASTRANGGNFGNDVTNPSNSNMSYGNNQLNVNNGNYSGTLTKANPDNSSNIQKAIRSGLIQSNVGLKAGGKTPEGFTSDHIR